MGAIESLAEKAKITAVIRLPDGSTVIGEVKEVSNLSFEFGEMCVIGVGGKAYIVGKQNVALVLENKEKEQ